MLRSYHKLTSNKPSNNLVNKLINLIKEKFVIKPSNQEDVCIKTFLYILRLTYVIVFIEDIFI